MNEEKLLSRRSKYTVALPALPKFRLRHCSKDKYNSNYYFNIIKINLQIDKSLFAGTRNFPDLLP